MGAHVPDRRGPLLRRALHDWLHLYNEQWLVERHGFCSPGSGASRPVGDSGGGVGGPQLKHGDPLAERWCAHWP